MTTTNHQPTPPAPVIALLTGGTSAEREVSLRSGAACADALRKNFPQVETFQIDTNALPPTLDPKRHVVFSTLHGTFGEDGGMQRLLEKAGITYAGCDSAASALTMDKTATKRAAAAAGVPVIEGFSILDVRHLASLGPRLSIDRPHAAPPPPSPICPTSPKSPTSPTSYPPLTLDAFISRHGPHLILKPNAEGSSVGLHIITNRAELDTALADARAAGGAWLLERRIFGRELAVGILNGRAMGIVEIRPKSETGAYDYESKYTAGRTDYLAPAPLDDATAARVRALAETAYAACGCRDFARVDFMLSSAPIDGEHIFLIEINTLPGMTALSLLPKSAGCIGLDFPALVREMLAPAIARFHAANAAR